MSSIILTAATDIFVIAGAATVATVALKSQKASFRTTLGADDEDDSLVSSENREDAVDTRQRQKSSINDDMKAPTVTIDEVAATPPAVETLGSGFFAGVKAV
ncbi:hypothetical protein BDR22DRAFT_886439 [Usnea florida]